MSSWGPWQSEGNTLCRSIMRLCSSLQDAFRLHECRATSHSVRHETAQKPASYMLTRRAATIIQAYEIKQGCARIRKLRSNDLLRDLCCGVHARPVARDVKVASHVYVVGVYLQNLNSGVLVTIHAQHVRTLINQTSEARQTARLCVSPLPSPGDVRVHGSTGVCVGSSSSGGSFKGGTTFFSISASLGALSHCMTAHEVAKGPVRRGCLRARGLLTTWQLHPWPQLPSPRAQSLERLLGSGDSL